MLNREEFLKTVNKLSKAAETYYTTDTQIITDAEYDFLLSQVEQAAETNGWDEADALINKVAAGFTGDKTITHIHPMLSMLKVKTVDEVEKFATNVGDVVLEPKLDGLAVALQYVDGKLVSAATRGDGFIGENITVNILNNTIKNLPHNIKIKQHVEIRGELYMTHADFVEANKERIKRTGKPFANSRNATAGVIRNENEANPYATLSFASYDAVGLQTKTYMETVSLLKKDGFQPAYSLTGHLSGTIADKIREFGENKNYYDFPTDGIVIKVDSSDVRKSLGEGNKYPHWARAYKYEDEQQITVLKSIELSIGRTGALTLTGIFDPVQLEGTTVTKATLNNVEYVQNNNIRVGGEIIVQKANMIIPQIVAGINNENLPAFNPSTRCPQCSQEMDTTTSVIWRCLNPECSLLESIIYWCSPAAMDVDGLSEKLITAMLEQNLIASAFELYKLTPVMLEKLVVREGVTTTGEKFLLGEKRANTLYRSIQTSKTQPLWRLLAALNIRHLGRTLSKTIVKTYPHIDEVFSLTVEQLKSLEGIAEEKATVIYEGLQAKKHLLPLIKKTGFTLKAEKTKTTVTNNDWIMGKKFVITGSFDNYNRDQLKEKLETLGGISSSSVTSKTDMLIVGENAGSKLEKAEQLGVKIVDETKLNEFLSN
jgi:DNA ligase (NAD+)